MKKLKARHKKKQEKHFKQYLDCKLKRPALFIRVRKQFKNDQANQRKVKNYFFRKQMTPKLNAHHQSLMIKLKAMEVTLFYFRCFF